MQAILLAAGKGTRLRPITNNLPKPLIDVCGKSIIERSLSSLPDEIDEVVIVINYLGEMIKSKVGTEFEGKKLTYLKQEPLNGTAGAVILAKDILKEKFLVINADDIYQKNDLEKLIQEDISILVYETEKSVSSPAIVNTENKFLGLGTKSGPNQSSFLVCGAYLLNKTFFEQEPIKIQVGQYTELGLPQTLAQMCNKMKIHAVKAKNWIPIGTPEELETARQALCKD